jgi:hypothetical protein
MGPVAAVVQYHAIQPVLEHANARSCRGDGGGSGKGGGGGGAGGVGTATAVPSSGAGGIGVSIKHNGLTAWYPEVSEVQAVHSR